MTAIDEVKRKFTEQIKLRAYDDQYIDKIEEKEILQIAIADGVSVDAARGALKTVCEQCGYVVESEALNQARQVLEQFAENDGKIDEKEFLDAIGVLKRTTKGKRTEVQCKRMIVQIIEDNSYRVKTGWFSNWYTTAKKEVGL
jgi:hypothetical protein